MSGGGERLAFAQPRHKLDRRTPNAAVDDTLIRSAQFRRGREQGWRKLEALVQRIEAEGIATLSPSEAQDLPLLYRSAMSSLSVARAIVLDRNLLLYLEDLTLRSYLAVYGPRAGMVERALEFVRAGFPKAVRGMQRHLMVAFLAMAVGIAAGCLLVMDDMNYYTMLVPDSMAQSRGPHTSAEELKATELFPPWPGFTETFVVFANSLFRHNSLIGIFSFGLGFVLGIPTLLLLAYNGLIIGAFVALHADKGLTVDFIGWLCIHGVTELLAILLCGAAGLLVAEKIVFPGPLSRLDSLARYGRVAAGVVAGAVGMLFIAGILEGGFRQLINLTPARYAFGATTAALWLLYFSRAGRGKEGDHG